MAKQLLPLNSQEKHDPGDGERLLPLAKPKRFWVITNGDLRAPILRQLKSSTRSRSLPSLRGETPRRNRAGSLSAGESAILAR